MLAPRLTAVVVFPTPPFWFATATTVPTALNLRFRSVGKVFGGERPGPAANEGVGRLLPPHGGIKRRTRPERTRVLRQGALACHSCAAREPLRCRRNLAVDVQMPVLGGRIGLHRDHLLHRHANLLRG